MWSSSGSGSARIGRRSAFDVNRAHGKHVNACFVGAGVAIEYMDANTPAFEREEIFKRYRAGVTKIICSIGVLVAGVDEDVRCVVMARPTKSPILWVQMIGRGLRRAEGKDRLVIIDHTMNSRSLAAR
jgi:DNA repair protein RadD